MTQTDKMLSRKEGRVGYMIFNNPERHNAVSLEMWEATTGVLVKFADDDEVRVVVLTGAGGKAFVSGADISKFASERASIEATRAYDVKTAAAFNSIYEFPKPTAAEQSRSPRAHRYRQFFWIQGNIPERPRTPTQIIYHAIAIG